MLTEKVYPQKVMQAFFTHFDMIHIYFIFEC
jgi:hypothetical protein